MAEKKTEIVPVRLTATQAERVRELAEEDGRSLSEWFRELARREISTKPAA